MIVGDKQSVGRGLRSWLLSEGGSRSAVFWNAVGSGLYAGQCAIVLVFVSRVEELGVAGELSLAYAVANLLGVVARFGMRNYQVTDLDERFSFAMYRASRALTVGCMSVVAVAYSAAQWGIGAYSLHKALLVLAVCALKLVDGVEDVYVARYQQAGHFLTGARMTALRQACVTGLMCMLVALRVGTIVAVVAGVAVSALMLAVLVRLTFPVAGTIASGKSAGDAGASVIFSGVRALLAQCLPLCVGLALSNYVGNMPKYAIDAYLGAEVQAVFGYIMLPVFVITLLNQFMYQPFVRDLGNLWGSGDVAGFRRMVGRHCALVGGLGVAVGAAGLLVGLPLLSVVYAVDLTDFRAEFAVLMAGGALYTLASYLAVPLTAMRRQRLVMVANAAAVALALVLQGAVVPRLGLMGAAALYVAQCALLLCVLGVGFVRSARLGQ